MRHIFTYRYTYRDELRSMFVQYVDGAVSVTDNNGAVHSLTYSGGVITGPGNLAETHRAAIAEIIENAIANVESTLAAFGALNAENP